MIASAAVTDSHCTGIEFTVKDVDALAKAIACILVQEFELATALLAGTTGSQQAIEFSQPDIDDIITRRLRTTDTAHRDGFLFQLMMWLAAHLDCAETDIIALPHSQASAKGQDSLIVHFAGNSLAAVTICEDKATVSPRDVVRDDVWPEFATYEKGERADELRSGVISIICYGAASQSEAARIVRAFTWDGNRHYRVRVTVEPQSRTPGLFKDFPVAGDVSKRRGETVALPDMRQWMSDLSARVESELRLFIPPLPNV